VTIDRDRLAGLRRAEEERFVESHPRSGELPDAAAAVDDVELHTTVFRSAVEALVV
jgi:hypothetical protein